VETLLTRRLDERRWEALVRPARRLREGVTVDFGGIVGRLLTAPQRGLATIELTASADVDDLLPAIGEMPLPPYFRGGLEDDERYQTIFAKDVGSAAAPTAGLHFTRRLVQRLQERGVALADVDLHVGIDTFRPMEEGAVDGHRIHTEWFEVGEATADAVRTTGDQGHRVVAVGTTVVRALETAAGSGAISAMSGHSSLFITPGYRSRVVDAVVTNFHAPRTTLLALVAAYLGPRWRSVYEHAIESGYRFLSFGDAMLIDDPVNR
jgi:S-adenosylmethionine:tRNA ribosyltransferase-isomerase